MEDLYANHQASFVYYDDEDVDDAFFDAVEEVTDTPTVNALANQLRLGEL